MGRPAAKKKRTSKLRSARKAGAGVRSDRKAMASPETRPFLIVGIGASAGGLAAFKSFFANIPAGIGMAFVLVQHLAPSHKSMLVELLKPHSALPIVAADDNVEVEQNRIYVIPPDATLTMQGGLLRVSSPAPERAQRRPIDTFFGSLAENHHDCAVGIILSGVGSDGTQGVQAI